jgi:hypothetical protein
MITLQIPKNSKILAAVGTIALRQGQLDYILRMTVKSLLGLSIQDALNATDKQGSSELRKRVRKLAKQKFGEGLTLVRLDAILTKARRATESRNEILHRLWAFDKDNNPVIRDDDHSFRPAPDISELNTAATELANITAELNDARLDGFLNDALS